MKKIFSVAAAGLAVAVFAAAARADQNWAGPYVGANVGYGWGTASTSLPGDSDGDGLFGSGRGNQGEPADGGFNHSLHREVYGLFTGYNVPVWNNVYAGFEATYDQANILATSVNDIVDVQNPGDNRSYQTKVNALFSLAPQVGYAWGKVLFRAKGGFAVGRVYTAESNDTQANTFGQDQTHVGWTFGLGADYAVTDHVVAGLAYDYYDLGVIQYGGQSAPDNNYPLSYEVHPILRTLSARVAYKF